MEEKTSFASPQRSSSEIVLNEHELINSQNLFSEIFRSMSGISAIINIHRQIVYGNEDFLKMLGINNIESVLGKRFGEAFFCIHSDETPGRCGTTPACAYCGAVNSVLESQKTGVKTVKETRLSTINDGKVVSWDLKISSAPITISDKRFYVVSFQDISDEKRRSALERIFFHDLLNSAGGLNGLLTILKEGVDPDEEHELIVLSEEASRDIIDEITMHRQIRAAESGELQTKMEEVNTIDFLESAVSKILYHDVGKDKQIIVSEDSVNTHLMTDRILFQRVIINLLKNALEATDEGRMVHTGVELKDEILRFWVKNDKAIPQDVQMQLFQRSFSTKDHSRGIGTYSIRLLTENYLNGKVSFRSNETEGTIFSVEFNKKGLV